MRLRLLVLVISILALKPVYAAEQNVFSFMTYKTFSKLPQAYRIFYVTGLTDAFTALAAKTGRMKGLGNCLRSQQVTPKKIEQLVSEVLLANPEYQNKSMAQAYEIANRAACNSFITDDLQKKFQNKPTQ